MERFCRDAPVPHVENLSNWTGSEVPGAQGRTVGQRSEREMDEVASKEARRADLTRGEKELALRDLRTNWWGDKC